MSLVWLRAGPLPVSLPSTTIAASSASETGWGASSSIAPLTVLSKASLSACSILSRDDCILEVLSTGTVKPNLPRISGSMPKEKSLVSRTPTLRPNMVSASTKTLRGVLLYEVTLSFTANLKAILIASGSLIPYSFRATMSSSRPWKFRLPTRYIAWLRGESKRRFAPLLRTLLKMFLPLILKGFTVVALPSLVAFTDALTIALRSCVTECRIPCVTLTPKSKAIPRRTDVSVMFSTFLTACCRAISGFPTRSLASSTCVRSSAVLSARVIGSLSANSMPSRLASSVRASPRNLCTGVTCISRLSNKARVLETSFWTLWSSAVQSPALEPGSSNPIWPGVWSKSASSTSSLLSCSPVSVTLSKTLGSTTLASLGLNLRNVAASLAPAASRNSIVSSFMALLTSSSNDLVNQLGFAAPIAPERTPEAAKAKKTSLGLRVVSRWYLAVSSGTSIVSEIAPALTADLVLRPYVHPSLAAVSAPLTRRHLMAQDPAAAAAPPTGPPAAVPPAVSSAVRTTASDPEPTIIAPTPPILSNMPPLNNSCRYRIIRSASLISWSMSGNEITESWILCLVSSVRRCPHLSSNSSVATKSGSWTKSGPAQSLMASPVTVSYLKACPSLPRKDRSLTSLWLV